MADDTGDALVRSGLVSAGALEEARRLVGVVGGTIGEQLVDNDAISDDDLTEFYAQKLQVPRIRASALARISNGVIETIPREMAIALRAIPILRSRDNRLTVAMSDPADNDAVEQISSVTQRHIVRAVATQMQIAWCLAHYFDHVTQLGRRLVQSASDTKPHRRAAGPAIATRPRGKTASGEIRITNREAPTAADAVGIAEKPRRAVEVLGTEDDTAKIVARRRRKAEAPLPPELEARAGEVDLKPGPQPQVTSGPTIVVELGTEAATLDTDETPPMIVHRTQVSEYADEEPTSPMWFERASSEDAGEPTKPGFRPSIPAPPAESDTPIPPVRLSRTTHVGVPPGPDDHREIPKPTEQWSEQTSGSPPPDPDHRDWGRPGTTIPPSLRGVPTPPDEDESDAIPLPSLDAPRFVLAPTSMTERSRPHSRSESGIARALEDTTQRVLTLIQHLETASDRDAVVSSMVRHLVDSHRRAGLFVVRSSELSLFSIEPAGNALSVATFPLDRPSTLHDVVDSRLPYRGPMNDPDSRAYLQTVLGACPPEILLVPIAVRERVVAVLFGEHRTRQTFDDQLALAARAAGMALERILMAKRG